MAPLEPSVCSGGDSRANLRNETVRWRVVSGGPAPKAMNHSSLLRAKWKSALQSCVFGSCSHKSNYAPQIEEEEINSLINMAYVAHLAWYKPTGGNEIGHRGTRATETYFGFVSR